ncbi:heme-binding SCHIC domain protein [Blastochloris viridis]|uniref:Heme-binding SCHIC domain protein n=2 Tax=Blastochloris viridis TaxID=1079 RepID=A0A182CZI3_BLAVI|nr:heme-binding SCHIC domain protein [Blastochloris viridis]
MAGVMPLATTRTDTLGDDTDRGVAALFEKADGSPIDTELTRTIEGEIIPRLMLVHRVEPALTPADDDERPALNTDEVAEFARLVMSHDIADASQYIEKLRSVGMSLETLFLDLLAPTARLLEDLWQVDLCDSTDVTVGLCHLQQLLREYGPAFETEVEHHEHGRRVLWAPLPGEPCTFELQHAFGVRIAEEFFRRAGWDVWSGNPGSVNELVSIVRREWFDLVGLTVNCNTPLDQVASMVGAIRRASCNRAVGVMVGGPMFVDHPEWVTQIGADAIAVDGRQAILQAQSLLGLMARRC